MRRAQHWMAAGFVAGLGTFFIVALDDVAHGPIYTADTAINNTVGTWEAWGFHAHAIGTALTQIGAWYIVALVVVAAAVWMLVLREWVLAAWLVGITVVSSAAVSGLKMLFDRPRPPLGEHLNASFPSGHTFGATATIGAAIILATEAYIRRRRRGTTKTLHIWALALGVAAALAFLTGIGRVLAQQHWMSDVLASWGLGLALVSGILFGLSRRERGGDPGPTVPEAAPKPAKPARKGRAGKGAKAAKRAKKAKG